MNITTNAIDIIIVVAICVTSLSGSNRVLTMLHEMFHSCLQWKVGAILHCIERFIYTILLLFMIIRW